VHACTHTDRYIHTYILIYIYIYNMSIISIISIHINILVHVFDAAVCLYIIYSISLFQPKTRCCCFQEVVLCLAWIFHKQLLCAKITRIRLGRQTPLSLWKARKTRESTNYIKKKPHGTVVVMMLPKASVQHLPKTDAFIKIDLPWGLPTFAADSWMVSRKSIFCRHGSNRSPPPNCLERHRC